MFSISDNTAAVAAAAVAEKPSRLWRSYGFFFLHFMTCFFSLEGRDRTGPPHSWKYRSGAGSELVTMAAVHVMSIQAKKKI